MKGQDRNTAWMEHILKLLGALRSGSDSLSEQERQTAKEIARFIDEMPGGFLIYRAEGSEEIIHANRALLRLFCCDSMEEFRAHTKNSFRGLVFHEDLESVERTIWRQVTESQYDLDYVEYRIVTKNGDTRWIEDYGHYLHSPSTGGVFYVFLGDATEKRSRQRQEQDDLLREKEEKLRSIIARYDQERTTIDQEYLRRLRVIKGLSITYESILYADMDKDKILPYRLSRRTKVLFEERFQRKPFAWYVAAYVDRWVHPEDRALVARVTTPDYIREKLSESSTYYVNYRGVVDDEIQYLQLRLVRVGHRDHASQIVMGYRRVDEELRREMEQTQVLTEALENAKLAITAKNTFLSNMSHDMRTPLNAISGFTALARRNLNDPAAVTEYLNRVEDSTRQLLDQINHVLELAYEETRENASTTETPCDLCQLMQEVYDFLLPQAEEKGLHFTFRHESLLHSGVYGDEEKLSQLVMYLVNNAITYTKHGGTVTMSLSEGEELPGKLRRYQLTVADTGVGISEEFRASIFEPFTREKNTTLSGVHGIGLGLTIAKSIVDKMGGTIDVQSAVGVGSTFTATLFLRPQGIPAKTGTDLPEESLQPQKILLVEDNALNLEIETELLSDLGFTIDTAVNGLIAVEKISASAVGTYDLILMDIQMPVMDGWEAAREIRRLSNSALAGIPIIALSANCFLSDVQRSMECGMDAHLGKPIDIPLLLKTIQEVTQGRA